LAGRGLDFHEGIQPRFVSRLDLSPSPEELLERMHPKTRYNIRLTQRKGVTVAEAHRVEDLKTFYKILQETALRDGFLIRSYDYFLTIWKEMVKRKYAQLFLASYHGEAIAGALAFIMGDKAWYLYGASSNRHRNLMSNHLLQWTMILWAKERGCRFYDFRGVSGDLNPDNPLYGLYRFKKGFGGTLTEFIGEYDRVYSPFLYWLWRKVYPLYAQGFRNLLLGRKRRERALLGD